MTANKLSAFYDFPSYSLLWLRIFSILILCKMLVGWNVKLTPKKWRPSAPSTVKVLTHGCLLMLINWSFFTDDRCSNQQLKDHYTEVDSEMLTGMPPWKEHFCDLTFSSMTFMVLLWEVCVNFRSNPFSGSAAIELIAGWPWHLTSVNGA